MPTYKCVERQRTVPDGHIFIFDSTFQEISFHTIRINESYPLFCNAKLSIGTAEKKRMRFL